MRWIVPGFFLFGSFINFVAADDRCRKEVSKIGMALKGYVFKTMAVTAPHKCEDICEEEITCQSYNYVIGEMLCELNNRTKETRPENFLSDPARFYIRRLNGRGMYSVNCNFCFFFVDISFQFSVVMKIDTGNLTKDSRTCVYCLYGSLIRQRT